MKRHSKKRDSTLQQKASRRSEWVTSSRDEPELVLDIPETARESTMPEVVVQRASASVLVLGKSKKEVVGFHVRSPHAMQEVYLFPIANPRKSLGGYASIANTFIDTVTTEVVGIVHADTTFAPRALHRLVEKAAEGFVTGLVGAQFEIGEVWGKNGGGPVSTLDSCSVFFPRTSNLRFDEVTFDDFHLCVEDLCMQAKTMGISSYVPAVYADHIGCIDRPANWMSNYEHYHRLFCEKWTGHTFIKT